MKRTKSQQSARTTRTTRRRSGQLGLLALPAILTLSTLSVPAQASPQGTEAGPAGAAEAAGHREQRPNIVYVFADDFGWSNLSTGRTNDGNPSDFYETPTLERIAREGVAFDNAYASVNCTPTRNALLTGLYAPRPQNNVYLVGDLNRGGDDTLLYGPAQGREDGSNSLDPEAVTVGERLQDVGYTTGYIGKFHVTRTGEDVTALHGFDENLGGTSAGAPGAYHASDQQFASQIGPELDQYAADYTKEYVDENIRPYSQGVDPAALDALVGTDKHVSDALADATIDFIDRNNEDGDDPFFAFLSPYAVHTPIGDRQARADLLAKYQAKTPGATSSHASYGALTEGLDQSVARVVHHLETTPDPDNPGHPLADNTIVVFTSDNGGVERFTDNGPLRGQKGELREGGIRVPLIAWSGNPELVDGDRVNHTPVYATDHHATIASLAGARVPGRQPLDGVDLSGLFADPDARVRRDALYWHLPGYLVDEHRDQRPQSVIRSGRWKLSYSYEDGSWELYDLREDVGETDDLAEERPELVRELGRDLIRWLDELNAPLATLREGRAPVEITVSGTAYANDRATRHHGDTLVIQPGEEVPLVLQAPRHP
ncbi:sulfatase [Streptomyces sp. 4N509B]|uniref:sulfatase n=1 Tax=Streptomyces sp. 4N509B TaxID=3457413 RepID=UPI003FD66F38